jgi:hypothetical protein
MVLAVCLFARPFAVTKSEKTYLWQMIRIPNFH